MILNVQMNEFNYDVVIKKGVLNQIDKYLDLNRKVLVVTDSGIPQEYKETIKNQINDCYIYEIEQGEKSKSFENYSKILDYLINNSFTRSDCVIALGGGVCGDLAGFVAASYMRGITFYNIPTTLLSQVDSSIGGKTAIDKLGYKNVIGAFYPPSKVLIDSNVLKTLDVRQFNSGLVEAIKMGATNDERLFKLIKNSKDIYDDIELVIEKALCVKKEVVEKDPKEKHLRKVLNFGHTIGHAIESCGKFNALLHGECVGLGMLYITSGAVREEIKEVLEKYNLPVQCNVSSDDLYKFILLDKKRSSEYITVVNVEKIGEFEINKILIEDIKKYLK
ncbi:MAG: 3-dehydroquinate synthase [Bacilli bacterium]|nr:3-dehydroquinate synthase [Bacilli bacterium]